MEKRPYPVYPYEVQPREVDLNRKATIITLGDCILHAAGEDADRIGFGIRKLQHGGSTWVLSRMAIEVGRYPDEYESYSVGTWVGEIGRLMTIRNFLVHDGDGRQIAAASTCWAMIDMDTRRPLDLRENIDYSNALIPLPCPIASPARIARIGGEEVDRHRVRYSDIDFNRHTNSMKYIQWMIDTLPLEKITGRPMRRLDINFLHETRYGQSLSIRREEEGATERFEIRTEDGTPACRAAFTWSEP